MTPESPAPSPLSLQIEAAVKLLNDEDKFGSHFDGITEQPVGFTESARYAAHQAAFILNTAGGESALGSGKQFFLGLRDPSTREGLGQSGLYLIKDDKHLPVMEFRNTDSNDIDAWVAHAAEILPEGEYEQLMIFKNRLVDSGYPELIELTHEGITFPNPLHNGMFNVTREYYEANPAAIELRNALMELSVLLNFSFEQRNQSPSLITAIDQQAALIDELSRTHGFDLQTYRYHKPQGSLIFTPKNIALDVSFNMLETFEFISAGDKNSDDMLNQAYRNLEAEIHDSSIIIPNPEGKSDPTTIRYKLIHKFLNALGVDQTEQEEVARQLGLE